MDGDEDEDHNEEMRWKSWFSSHFGKYLDENNQLVGIGQSDISFFLQVRLGMIDDADLRRI